MKKTDKLFFESDTLCILLVCVSVACASVASLSVARRAPWS